MESIHAPQGKLVPKSAPTPCCPLSHPLQAAYQGQSWAEAEFSPVKTGVFKSKCLAIKKPLENYWHMICATAHQYMNKGEEFANFIAPCSGCPLLPSML